MNKTLLTVAWLVLTAPIAAQLRAGRSYQLSTTQVARAVASRFADQGVMIIDSDVALLANVVATTPDPSLEVRSVDRLPANGTGKRSAVKVSCKVASECLPFYAVVRWSGRKPHELNAPMTSLPSPSSDPALLIRSGSPATLLLRHEATQIRMNVITLQGGLPGQNIRVAALTNRQVYVGRVVNAGLLEGNF